MSLIDWVPTGVAGFAPLLLVTAVVIGLLWAAHVLIIARHPELGSERLFPRQLLMFGLTLAGLVAIALALPVSDTARAQIIGLLGLLASGVIAFSSSTIFANLMSGIMLRITKPFHTGDFITVGEHFGRVVERGLLDTEIQTENRDLVALPNTVLISHPVTVVRSSGAYVTATLSLGYDVHHEAVEARLLAAAKACGLTDPFVRVLELGNFAITYRISGLLTDTKGLLTARSDLNRQVLDALHGDGIEIVSPSFMNQRGIGDAKIVPARSAAKPHRRAASTHAADTAVARSDAARERLLDRIQKREHQLEGAHGEERERLQAALDKDQAALKKLAEPGDQA